MYRKSATGAPARHVWCKSRAGCWPRCRRAAAASASCPRTSWPHSVRLEATPRPTIIMLLLPAHTMTLCAATATDYVRIRRFSSTGTFVQLHDLLCSRKHARVTANGRPGAFHVDRLCWPGVVRAGDWQAVLTRTPDFTFSHHLTTHASQAVSARLSLRFQTPALRVPSRFAAVCVALRPVTLLRRAWIVGCLGATVCSASEPRLWC